MPRIGNERVIDIRGSVLHKTEKAFRFRPEDSDEACWLPMSQCEWYPEDETMVIPEWLATEKGLI